MNLPHVDLLSILSESYIMATDRLGLRLITIGGGSNLEGADAFTLQDAIHGFRVCTA